MNRPFPDPTRQRAAAQAALVVVLHPANAEHVALGLVRAWAPVVPAAKLSALSVAGEDGAERAREEVADRLGQAGLDPSRLVLAGVGGAQGTALQLAFGKAASGCAGVLACGDPFLPLAALAGQPLPGWPKLRLVWTADDPLSRAAALGSLLRCLRAAGLDAQGAVLPRPDRSFLDAGALPPLVRRGGAYLAELVAVALNTPARPHAALVAAAGGRRSEPVEEQKP